MMDKIKGAMPKSKGGMVALAVAFFVAFSVSFALITFPEFVVVDLVAGKEVPAVVKLPRKIVGALVCNSAAKGVGKIVGHIPIIGGAIHGAQEDACALNELFNVAESAGLSSAVRQAFDCSTFKPSENPEPGVNCSEESIGFEDGGGSSTAIPANARWLIPIYQKAAAYYKIPWPLLAAINKMETNYGQDLSESTAGAGGWMQFEPETWAAEAVHAGEMPGQGSSCHYPTSKTPTFTSTVKSDPGANICNPVDAIFTAAKYLASDGAAGHTTWTGYTTSCEDPVSKAVFAYNHDCNSISILGGVCYGYVHCAHVFYAQIVAAETGSPEGGPEEGSAASGSITTIAHSQVGHGPEQKYWYFDPGGFGEEWCAAFASWVWHNAGVQHWTGTAAAGGFVTWGQEHGSAHAFGSGYKPQPGDAIVYGYDGHGYALHVGLVYQVFPNGDISSVAGNGYGDKVNFEAPFNPAEATAAGEPGPISYYVSPGITSGGGASSGGINIEEATKYVKSLHVKVVGFSVFNDSGTELGEEGGATTNLGRSITKTMILTAYLRKIGTGKLSATAKTHLEGMIEQSNNEDANWVYNALNGENSTASHANSASNHDIEAVAHDANMSSFSLVTTDPVYVLGESKITATDMARFFGVIDKLMPPSQSSYGMGLLGHIGDAGTPGHAGVYEAGVATGTIYSKSGWESESDGAVVNQVARIVHEGKTYNIAVVTKSGSEKEGEDIIKNVFQKLFVALPEEKKSTKPVVESTENPSLGFSPGFGF